MSFLSLPLSRATITTARRGFFFGAHFDFVNIANTELSRQEVANCPKQDSARETLIKRLLEIDKAQPIYNFQ
jgi:hypothetical protein